MALSGAVDLVSTDRNSPDRRRSERKTFRRNPLAATIPAEINHALSPSGMFSDFCKISVTTR